MKTFMTRCLAAIVIMGVLLLGVPTLAVHADAGLTLDKVPDKAVVSVGENITYEYTISNTGSENITSLSLIDDKLGPIVLASTTLEGGDNLTASMTYHVKSSDIPGPIENTAIVTGMLTTGENVSAIDSAEVAVVYDAAIQLEKTATPASAAPGDVITYEFVVTNTGDGEVTGLVLNDDMLGGPISLSDTTLAVGGNVTASATYEVQESDITEEFIVNTANVTGTLTATSENVSASDTAEVAVEYNAAIQLEKTVTPAVAAPHQVVTYMFTITNAGNVSLEEVTLSDPKLATEPITLPQTSLAVGESITVSQDYEIQVADLPSPMVNTATVQAEDPTGALVTSQSEATVTLSVIKSLLKKAEILWLSGVPGKGILTAPGLQKQFNPKSQATEHAGKKPKNSNQNQNQNQIQNQNLTQNQDQNVNQNQNQNNNRNKNKNKNK